MALLYTAEQLKCMLKIINVYSKECDAKQKNDRPGTTTHNLPKNKNSRSLVKFV